jgi:tRNA-dihydrouridine synthase C
MGEVQAPALTEAPPLPWALLRSATPARPALALAPMEGISDAVVRELLSALGGMDFCVTEFIRVAHRPVPASVLLRECPELRRGGRTASGTPVMVQLLGGEPALVAETARTAVALGAVGIDLNFGCPAKRVNGSDGGASLLRCPPRVTDVVRATREAVPAHLPVSAKVRLGWEDPDDVVPIVRAAEAGGAAWITVHGRTKVQMYKPFADWTRIRRAQDAVTVPVIANGDLFDPGSFARCQEVTGAAAYMLGRGAFRTPNLFRWLRGLDARAWSFEESCALLFAFVRRVHEDPRYDDPQRAALNRLKGWVRAMADVEPAMLSVFEVLKRAQALDEALRVLEGHLGEARRSAAS